MAEIKSDNMRKLLTVIAFIGLIFCGKLQAQSTSSPYSMFGVGEIDSRTYGLNSGMGGAGIGLQLHNFMNNSNPASLAGIDSLAFVFDAAAASRLSYFTYGKEKNNTKNMNLKKLAFGFRIFPKLAVSVGLRSFSSVGYKLYSETPIEGSTQNFRTDFEGSGGLSRLYLSSSYKLTSKLSVGANTSLLFGTIDQTETQSNFLITRSSYTRKFYFDFGAQYSDKINTSLYYTLGAIYGYKATMTLHNNTIVSRASGTELSNTDDVSTKTSIPQFFGAGGSLISMKGSRGFIIAADYRFENWGAIKSSSPMVKFLNSHKINAGVQYLPNTRIPKNYLQRIQYQFGAKYNLSHLQIEGQRLKEYALTLGMNLPMRNPSSHSWSYIHFSVDFGYRGGQNLIKENYVLFTLGCSLNELWFFKNFYH